VAKKYLAVVREFPSLIRRADASWSLADVLGGVRVA
jgi:hypothetical protein